MKAGYSLTAADDDAMLERSRANSHGLCIQSCLFARMTRRCLISRTFRAVLLLTNWQSLLRPGSQGANIKTHTNVRLFSLEPDDQ